METGNAGDKTCVIFGRMFEESELFLAVKLTRIEHPSWAYSDMSCISKSETPATQVKKRHLLHDHFEIHLKSK